MFINRWMKNGVLAVLLTSASSNTFEVVLAQEDSCCEFDQQDCSDLLLNSDESAISWAVNACEGQEETNVCHEVIYGGWGWSICGKTLGELNNCTFPMYASSNGEGSCQPSNQTDHAANVDVSVNDTHLCFDFQSTCDFTMKDSVQIHIGTEPLPGCPDNCDASPESFEFSKIFESGCVEETMFCIDREEIPSGTNAGVHDESDDVYCIAIQTKMLRPEAAEELCGVEDSTTNATDIPSCSCQPDVTTATAQCISIGIGSNNPSTSRQCKAMLTRRSGSLTVEVSDLENFIEGHAYTIWFSSCKYGTRCSAANGDRQLYNLGGFVHPPTGPLRFLVPDLVTSNGECPLTEPCVDQCDQSTKYMNLDGRCVEHPSDECSIIYPLDCSVASCEGLYDAEKDRIALWFKDHGKYEHDVYGDEQLATFNGGCTTRSIMFPKESCPPGENYCRDVANVRFFP